MRPEPRAIPAAGLFCCLSVAGQTRRNATMNKTVRFNSGSLRFSVNERLLADLREAAAAEEMTISQYLRTVARDAVRRWRAAQQGA